MNYIEIDIRTGEPIKDDGDEEDEKKPPAPAAPNPSINDLPRPELEIVPRTDKKEKPNFPFIDGNTNNQDSETSRGGATTRNTAEVN